MRHPIQDMYRRHTTGGDDALLRAHGLEEGRRDALAKRPSNPLAALQRLSNAHDETFDPSAHDLDADEINSIEVFRSAYNEGYAEGADAMEAAKPGAKGELKLINLAESLKIDRDTHPAEFAKWEKQQAAKMTGLNAASIEAASELGLAVLIGLARARDPFKDASSGTSTGASETSPALAAVEGMLLGAVLGGAGVGYLALKYARKEHAYGLQEAATGILENVPTGNVTYRDIVGAMNNTAKHYQWQAAQALK